MLSVIIACLLCRASPLLAADAAAMFRPATKRRCSTVDRGRADAEYSSDTHWGDAAMMDDARLGKFVGRMWDDEIVPTLVEYIRIPNKSPSFDPEWEAHGHMAAAVGLFEGWARGKLAALPGATLEVVRLPGRTPLILIEVPGTGKDTVLLYGHLDKQPEMVGWTEGYGPWIPRIEGDKLYGRGGADDGYAMFGALSAI